MYATTKLTQENIYIERDMSKRTIKENKKERKHLTNSYLTLHANQKFNKHISI